MARELTIAGALGSLDAPTVRPAATVDAGPYFANGCVISLWDFAPGRAADEDADGTAVARSLRDLHQALEQVETELPSFTASVDTCETILSDHAEARNIPPDDRLFLTRRFSTLREQLGHRQLDCRPLHGDTHLANVLVTSSGPVWMDLEAVCTGPLEWDLVALPPSVRSEFSGSDPDLLRLLAELRSVCVATWCWADFERSAETAEAAIYHLDRLKARLGSSG
jgi:Ser/Thr protein kinase RdoA (MazF antagonist)